MTRVTKAQLRDKYNQAESYCLEQCGLFGAQLNVIEKTGVIKIPRHIINGPQPSLFPPACPRMAELITRVELEVLDRVTAVEEDRDQHEEYTQAALPVLVRVYENQAANCASRLSHSSESPQDMDIAKLIVVTPMSQYLAKLGLMNQSI